MALFTWLSKTVTLVSSILQCHFHSPLEASSLCRAQLFLILVTIVFQISDQFPYLLHGFNLWLLALTF
jgi:hypothetical protein